MPDCSSGPIGLALVIEPGGLIAMAARENLLDCGFAEVTVAGSSGAALALIHAGSIGFALIDASDPDVAFVAAALDDRAIPFALACDEPDGPNPPERWAERPFVIRPYGQRELRAVLVALGIMPGGA